jgi:diguanylate cyclase (GGDEF)-like protein
MSSRHADESVSRLRVSDRKVKDSEPAYWPSMQYLLLGGIQFLAAIQFFVYAVWPPLPSTPKSVDFMAGCVSVLLALFSMFAVPRLPEWGVLFSLSVSSFLIFLVTAVTLSPAGQVLNGMSLVLVGVFAAYFLPARKVWMFMFLVMFGYVIALVIAPTQYTVLYASTVVVTVVAVTFVVVMMVTKLRVQALKDPLTGVLNRRGLEEAADLVHLVSSRVEQTTSVVIIDLDNFKSFNDLNGHNAGDSLLKGVTSSWGAVLRGSDVLSRVGGDEFVLVLPETTYAQAEMLLKRLRAVNMTSWSAGIAEWRYDETLYGVISRADKDLYQAKASLLVEEGYGMEGVSEVSDGE